MTEIRYLEIGADRRIAYRCREGRGPPLIFLPGYMSDMEGGKATALDAWAGRQDRAMIRFDYGGCGASDGEFEAQGLADWGGDVLAIMEAVAEGQVVLVGSSMGAWVMLLAALARPERVAGLIGIAAAPDFTEWGFTDEQKRTIFEKGRLVELSAYDKTPYVTSRTFWESGQSLRLLEQEIPIDCPVRLLHGIADTDVPPRMSLEVMRLIRSADVQATLVKDGDHRLSRDQDIALLVATVEGLMERLDS